MCVCGGGGGVDGGEGVENDVENASHTQAMGRSR